MPIEKISAAELTTEREENQHMFRLDFLRYICDKYNISSRTASRRYKELHEMGGEIGKLFDYDRYTKKDMLEEDREEKKRMYNEWHIYLKLGHSVKEIASRWGVSEYMVRYRFKKMGISTSQYKEVNNLEHTKLFPTGATMKDKHGNIMIDVMCMCSNHTQLWVRKSDYLTGRSLSCGCGKREWNKF